MRKSPDLQSNQNEFLCPSTFDVIIDLHNLNIEKTSTDTNKMSKSSFILISTNFDVEHFEICTQTFSQ